MFLTLVRTRASNLGTTTNVARMLRNRFVQVHVRNLSDLVSRRSGGQQMAEQASGSELLDRARGPGTRRHILILVENMSVPTDRRVWQESRALIEAGFKVTVICPASLTRDRESESVIDGVRIL